MEVSENFSLGFFFPHFQGLKILPRLENLPLRLDGGVPSPELPPSLPVELRCRSTSSSGGAEHRQKRDVQYK
jgi:hypothetical protein